MHDRPSSRMKSSGAQPILVKRLSKDDGFRVPDAFQLRVRGYPHARCQNPTDPSRRGFDACKYSNSATVSNEVAGAETGSASWSICMSEEFPRNCAAARNVNNLLRVEPHESGACGVCGHRVVGENDSIERTWFSLQWPVPFHRHIAVDDGRFNLAYFRHTGQFREIAQLLLLDECLAKIGAGGLFYQGSFENESLFSSFPSKQGLINGTL